VALEQPPAKLKLKDAALRAFSRGGRERKRLISFSFERLQAREEQNKKKLAPLFGLI